MQYLKEVLENARTCIVLVFCLYFCNKQVWQTQNVLIEKTTSMLKDRNYNYKTQKMRAPLMMSVEDYIFLSFIV